MRVAAPAEGLEVEGLEEAPVEGSAAVATAAAGRVGAAEVATAVACISRPQSLQSVEKLHKSEYDCGPPSSHRLSSEYWHVFVHWHPFASVVCVRLAAPCLLGSEGGGRDGGGL